MVLSFIDLENGVTFNGHRPYEFWFDEGQSVNLIYAKRIAFMSLNSQETITVETGTPFFLIDTNSLQSAQQTHISDEDYFDLTTVGATTIASSGTLYNDGSGSSSKIIHSFFICCRSEEAGQFKATFTIDGEEFAVGADFYNEDERLADNLENMGIEIPSTVQKAIYESNVHEEATDNILMNRKWKELLLEYWRIAACKGSYRSLVSSLKWFEYGELVKILEYWKREDVGRPVLISNDIEQILSDLFREQLSVLTKTTYIGLYLALEKPSGTQREDDEYPFYNSTDHWPASQSMMLNENNPVLERISSIWSAQDLMLKMTLVGNFFATYFMPIHLDLIHSTVENIVFTNAMKVMAGAMQAREDWIHCGGTFRCTSFTNGSDFYMQPVDCEVGALTILGLKDASYDFGEDPSITNEADTDYAHENCPTVLGYNLESGDTLGRQHSDLAPSVQPSTSVDIKDILFSATNRYAAYGAPVRFDIEILENVPESDFIKAAQIHWRRDYTELFDYRDSGIYIESSADDNGKLSYKFSFNLLFEKSGRYDIAVTFESARGVWYSNKFTINVIDDADNHISIYKIVRGDIDQWKDTQIQFSDGELTIYSPRDQEIEYDVNEFMFSSVEEFPEMQYAQFIHSDTYDFAKSVGLNHVLIVPTPVPNGGALKFEYVDGSASLDVSSATAQSLNSKFPNYWWIVRETELWMKNENTTEQFDQSFKGNLLPKKQNIIIGIRKFFTVETEARPLAHKRYYKGEKQYEVTVNQEGFMMCVSAWGVNCPGYKSYRVPISRTVKVDLFGEHTVTIDVIPDEREFSSNASDPNGSKEKRIVVKGYSSRLVDEDRFIPLFHKLVPITSENWDLGYGEACIAVPHFKRTQQDKIDELTLYFTHCGTASSTDTKPGISNLDDSDGEPTKVGVRMKTFTNPAQTIVAEYRRRPLKRGYYNVTARYKYNGDWHEEKQAGAFRIHR